MLTTVVVLAALLAAQGEGEGEGEAGEGEGEGEGEVVLDGCAADCSDGCVPACSADGVVFFDGVACANVVCEDGSVCGDVSAEFGADCLLPAGADCDPGYAGGVSRCASHACVDGVCGQGVNEPERPQKPTDGTAIDSAATTTSGCFGCPSTSLVVPFFGALLLRRRRRR